MLDIFCTLLGIAYTYMPTAPTKIYNRHETSQILTYQPHSNIWGHSFLMLPTPHSIRLDPFRTLTCEIIHQYDYHTQQDTSTFDPIQVTQLCHHTIMNPYHHRSITTRRSVWNEMRPERTADSLDFRTYIHGLVFIIPHTNYIYTTMNVIDHIYIGILLRSANKTINRCSSAFVTQH